MDAVIIRAGMSHFHISLLRFDSLPHSCLCLQDLRSLKAEDAKLEISQSNLKSFSDVNVNFWYHERACATSDFFQSRSFYGSPSTWRRSTCVWLATELSPLRLSWPLPSKPLLH